MHLPFHQHGIDDAAEIVEHVIGNHLYLAGFAVDLDFTGVAAVRKRWCGAVILAVAVEAVFETRNALTFERSYKFLQSNLAIRSFHPKRADIVGSNELDSLATGLQHVRSRVLAFSDHFVRRDFERPAGHIERARAAGTEAVHPISVALSHYDGFEGHAVTRRHYL